MNVTVPAMFCHAGPSLFVVFSGCLFLALGIYRSKFRRMDCSLNRSYINQGELHCDKIALKAMIFIKTQACYSGDVTLWAAVRCSSLGNYF